MSNKHRKTLEEISEHTKLSTLVIVASSGLLVVLYVPFKAILILDSTEHSQGEIVLILAVKTRKNDLCMMFMLIDETLPYYYFVLLVK